jgi:hypothetical protein
MNLAGMRGARLLHHQAITISSGSAPKNQGSAAWPLLTSG